MATEFFSAVLRKDENKMEKRPGLAVFLNNRDKQRGKDGRVIERESDQEGERKIEGELERGRQLRRGCGCV